MYWYEAPTKYAIEAGRTKSKEVKTAKTISMSLSWWALVEQIRAKHNLKNANEALHFCVYHTAQDEGMEV
jgi:hypothetical protein